MENDSPTGEDFGHLVFLSYRRADAPAHTLALKMELEKNFQGIRVFMDNSAIDAGDDFPDQIDKALNAATVVIALIGKKWTGTKKNRSRRIDDPEDWVGKEVGFALRNKRAAFLPVLLDGARGLTVRQLPEHLKDLASINALRIRMTEWDLSITKLVRLLEEKHQFKRKDKKRHFPAPDPRAGGTAPISSETLAEELRGPLRKWGVEFSDDPEHKSHKWVELKREFRLKTFDKAIEFADMLAAHSRAVEHYPRFLVSWKTVSVWTSTWDAGHRITAADIQFARHLDKQYRKLVPANGGA